MSASRVPKDKLQKLIEDEAVGCWTTNLLIDLPNLMLGTVLEGHVGGRVISSSKWRDSLL